MYQIDAQHNREIILESIDVYLHDFDIKYHSPLQTVTRQDCDRANYIQKLRNTILGNEARPHTDLPTREAQRKADHKMISVSLECLIYYRYCLNGHSTHHFGRGAINQQNQMYNDRLLKRQLDSTFWGLSKPFFASLPNTQLHEMKRLSGDYSPMEVIEILLSNEHELLGENHEEAKIQSTAKDMNQGHYDSYLSRPTKVHRLLRWLKHGRKEDTDA